MDAYITGAKKRIKGEITQKVIKGRLSFLCATHRHALFYITVKYHQNIPNGILVIERTRKCLWTDGRSEGHRYIPGTFRSGNKKILTGILNSPVKWRDNRVKVDKILSILAIL